MPKTLAAHTPGPWKWRKARTMQHLCNDASGCFASVSAPYNNRHFRPSPTMDADLALIAAAPELLAALEAAMSHLEAQQSKLNSGYKVKP